MADTKKKKTGTPADLEVGQWDTESTVHDRTAAANYLSLSASPAQADALADELLRSPLAVRRADDLLRASGLELLDKDDAQVAKDLKKLKRGEKLAPVLLLRGDVTNGRPLVVADGYHRICASYHVNENTGIPCRIADLPDALATL